MTEPAPETDLVVTPEQVAAKAGISTMTPAQREIIADAIRDAQADIVGYLGREISPQTRTATAMYPFAGGWSFPDEDETIQSVVSVTPETYAGTSPPVPTGLFTVTYRVGLDAANDPALRPIRRYVLTHAMNSPEVTRVWKIATGTQGEVRTLSAEGQSVTFTAPTLGGGGGKAGSGEPGALPTLASLDRWRLAGRRVYQAPTRYGLREPW
jgi:hypothetical protein